MINVTSILHPYSTAKPVRLLLALLLVVLCYSCSNTEKDLDIFNTKKTQTETLHQVKTYLSQNSKTKGCLIAPLMIRYTSDSVRVVFDSGIQAQFYQDNPKLTLGVDTNIIESKIFADYARYTEFNNKVFLSGNVICYNQIKNDTLWCDSLWWDQNTKEIYTWGNFQFKTHNGENMRGKEPTAGFTAKQDLSQYTLYRSRGTMVAPAGTIPTE
jgi:lipopolysaccharide assembly outer membrane protein LptD (OstA)